MTNRNQKILALLQSEQLLSNRENETTSRLHALPAQTDGLLPGVPRRTTLT